ncbi:MAG: hypothetical protein NT025_00145 [bacterium]|nr:hypothetical protein [bacterium]
MNDWIDPSVWAELEKKMHEDDYLRERGIFVDYVRPVDSQGKRLWALGKRLYYNRPESETFHDFIVGVLISTLGQQWWDANRHSSEPHFIMQCYLRMHEWRQQLENPENVTSTGTLMCVPDGYSGYLLSLAFDVCSLIHACNLPEPLLKRLRHKDQFQGARYEIAIASMFARLDCAVEFQDIASDPSAKRCEFLARHRDSGECIAVEAKSRHRSGVIHHPGTFELPHNLYSDLDRLFRDALCQSPGGLPYLIFVDVNLPLTPGTPVHDKRWFAAVNSIGDKFPSCNLQGRDPFNLVVFTNYGDHFQKDMPVCESEVIGLLSPNPLVQHPNGVLLDRLRLALRHYGFVPNIEARPRASG